MPIFSHIASACHPTKPLPKRIDKGGIIASAQRRSRIPPAAAAASKHTLLSRAHDLRSRLPNPENSPSNYDAPPSADTASPPTDSYISVAHNYRGPRSDPLLGRRRRRRRMRRTLLFLRVRNEVDSWRAAGQELAEKCLPGEVLCRSAFELLAQVFESEPAASLSLFGKLTKRIQSRHDWHSSKRTRRRQARDIRTGPRDEVEGEVEGAADEAGAREVGGEGDEGDVEGGEGAD